MGDVQQDNMALGWGRGGYGSRDVIDRQQEHRAANGRLRFHLNSMPRLVCMEV